MFLTKKLFLFQTYHITILKKRFVDMLIYFNAFGRLHCACSSHLSMSGLMARANAPWNFIQGMNLLSRLALYSLMLACD